MSQVSQPLDSDTTLVLRFGGQAVEPIKCWNGLGIL